MVRDGAGGDGGAPGWGADGGSPRPSLTRLRSALPPDALQGQAGRGERPGGGRQAEEEGEEGAAAGRAPGPPGLHRRHRLAGGDGSRAGRVSGSPPGARAKRSRSFFSSSPKFKRHVGEQEEDTDLWIGYSAFHLGDYKRALEVRGGGLAPRLGSGEPGLRGDSRRVSCMGNGPASQLHHRHVVGKRFGLQNLCCPST